MRPAATSADLVRRALLLAALGGAGDAGRCPGRQRAGPAESNHGVEQPVENGTINAGRGSAAPCGLARQRSTAPLIELGKLQ